jgi:hypothetical protein
MKKQALFTLALLFTLTLVSGMADGQSPPLGPPTFRKDDHQFGIGLLSNIVRAKVRDAVDSANTMIKKQTSLVQVQLKNFTVYAPYRVASENKDRPNQYYIDLPIDIEINVDITATSDRQIYFPLDLNISCDGWQTGKGSILILTQLGPSSIEGGNIIEDILQVRDYIDNQIRQNLVVPGNINILLPIPCETLGVVPRVGNDVLFGYVAYDPPSSKITLPDPLSPTLQVKLLRLKRLVARGNGAIIYNPSESITLKTYADFSFRLASLTMKEGDDVALNVAPIILTSPLYDKLVLIANIMQLSSGQVDSTFDYTLASANYSPGIHTLQVMKTYVIQPGLGNSKPIYVQVPGYELTYSVSYINPRGSQRAQAVGTWP